MIFIILFSFALILLVMLNLFWLKNKTILTKIFVSIGVFIVLVLIYIAVFVALWNSSKDPREERFRETNESGK